ncbi:MAG: SURF1 family protein [Pseudomonadota bacterium]
MPRSRFNRRIGIPILIGIVAVSILSGLGIWQTQRMAWKEGLLAEIATRLRTAPVALPAEPLESRDQFLQVSLEGRMMREELAVLTSRRPYGPGFKIVSAFELTDGRRILVDRGFVPESLKAPESRPDEPDMPRAIATGTLFWPNETDSFTPEPDRAGNIWFARDLPLMAETLGTEPILVSLTTPLSGEWPKPAPVAHKIPNNHLSYAVTWFLLALVWAVMTAIWIRGELRRPRPA